MRTGWIVLCHTQFRIRQCGYSFEWRRRRGLFSVDRLLLKGRIYAPISVEPSDGPKFNNFELRLVLGAGFG
jgi:hypothetical protein